MAKINTEITYEKDEDILSLWRGKSSRASIEIGDFIIDVDGEGYVSGLEILNASENLNINSEDLNKIETASMSVIYKPNYVTIVISFRIEGKEKGISIPLTVDLGHKTMEREQIVFSA